MSHLDLGAVVGELRLDDPINPAYGLPPQTCREYIAAHGDPSGLLDDPAAE